jgi:hypothetical protein
MAELIETFWRHREILNACGWVWDDADVAASTKRADSERLTLANELLGRWLAAAPEDFMAMNVAFFGQRQHLSLELLKSFISFRHPLLLVALAEPRCGSVAEMVTTAKPLLEQDAKLAGQFITLIANGLPERGFAFRPGMVERALDVVSRTSAVGCLTAFIVQLLRRTDRRVRSKAALLLGKASGNSALLYDRFIAESDPRVRANLIEGFWEVEAPGKSEVLWKAARDENHRVVANALVGLNAMGDGGAAAQLEKLSAHESPLMRAAVAWAMGVTEDRRYGEILTRMFKEDCSGPKRSALRALVRIRQASQSAA